MSRAIHVQVAFDASVGVTGAGKVTRKTCGGVADRSTLRIQPNYFERWDRRSQPRTFHHELIMPKRGLVCTDMKEERKK